MKWLNSYRIRLMLFVFMVAIVLGGGTAKADFVFGTPMPLDEPVNSTGIEYFGCISSDGLEVYIEKPVSGGIASRNWDIYMSTRETTNDPWSVPMSVGSTIHKGYLGGYASLSNDDLELYFSSTRPGGYGLQDIWVTTRDSKVDDWGDPVNLGPPINTSSGDLTPWITQDSLELYFSSDRLGGYGAVDIWVASRTTTNDEWGEPMNLGPVVNSTGGDYYPCLSPDGLVLFFSDYDNPSYGFRPGGHGRSDMWMTRRKSTADPWEPPVNLGPDMNTSSFDCEPRISPDGLVLYFTSTRPDTSVFFQNSDIWQAPIIPIVDLNDDGRVDAADMCIIVDNWGTDNSLCDIGPMPWGDGIVDVQDLIVLSEHLFEEVNLTTHWKLDETEGPIAYDSVGEKDGFLIGDPVWQSNAGMVDGALQFDGSDDHIVTECVLDPADGSFSVFVWIKGGAPGKVVVSQQSVADWLAVDSEGNLMTELKCTGRSAGPLSSETVITDGQWHRIGIVWDGSYRRLYVDGVTVAEDAQHGLEGSQMGLYIGTGMDMEAGTYFSGLIDDIRIYNRAVKP